MKAGFTTDTNIHHKAKFILVGNIPYENEIINFGVMNFEIYSNKSSLLDWSLEN